MRIFPNPLSCLLAAALALPGATFAAPHQHGVAKLDIAVDGPTLAIDFETPLDNLLGFERAPRNDAERKAADAAVATLKAGASVFRIDPAAQCTLDEVVVNSAPLKLGSPATKADDGHADLDASYRFTCKGTAPAFLDIGLFESFKRMRRIDVQVATGKAQSKLTLRRPAKQVPLVR